MISNRLSKVRELFATWDAMKTIYCQQFEKMSNLLNPWEFVYCYCKYSLCYLTLYDSRAKKYLVEWKIDGDCKSIGIKRANQPASCEDKGNWENINRISMCNLTKIYYGVCKSS